MQKDDIFYDGGWILTSGPAVKPPLRDPSELPPRDPAADHVQPPPQDPSELPSRDPAADHVQPPPQYPAQDPGELLLPTASDH